MAERAPAPAAPRPKERTPKTSAKPSRATDGAGVPPKASKPSNASPEPSTPKAAAKRTPRVDQEFDADFAKLTAHPASNGDVEGFVLEAERRRRATIYAFVGAVVGSVICLRL